MFRATPVFATDEMASDLSDTSSVDSGYSSETSHGASSSSDHLGGGGSSGGGILSGGGFVDYAPGTFECHLCVPYATVFFSQEAVTVKYNINVCIQGRRWSVDKRFSELLQLHKAVKEYHAKAQSIGTKFTQALLGGTKQHPTFPTFPSRRFFSGNTNTSIKAILSRRMELNTYFQVLTNPEFGFLCTKQLNATLFNFVSCPVASSAGSSSAGGNGTNPATGPTARRVNSGNLLQGGSGGWGTQPEFDLVDRNDFVNVVEREHVNAYFKVPDKYRVCTNAEWLRAAMPPTTTTSSSSFPASTASANTAPNFGAGSAPPASSAAGGSGGARPIHPHSHHEDPHANHHSTSPTAAGGTRGSNGGSSSTRATGNSGSLSLFSIRWRSETIASSSNGQTASSPSSSPKDDESGIPTAEGLQQHHHSSPFHQSSATARRRGSSLWHRDNSAPMSAFHLGHRVTAGGTYVVEPSREIISRMGAIPTLCFGLPNAKLCFNDNDPLQMMIVLRCKKFESRLSVKHRHEELLAFYGYVVHRGVDTIPDLVTTKNFFRRYQELHPLQTSSVVSSSTSCSSLSRELHPQRSGSRSSIATLIQNLSKTDVVKSGARTPSSDAYGIDNDDARCGAAHERGTAAFGDNDDDGASDPLPVVSLAALSRGGIEALLSGGGSGAQKTAGVSAAGVRRDRASSIEADADRLDQLDASENDLEGHVNATVDAAGDRGSSGGDRAQRGGCGVPAAPAAAAANSRCSNSIHYRATPQTLTSSAAASATTTATATAASGSPLRACRCTETTFCPIQAGCCFDTSCGLTIIIVPPPAPTAGPGGASSRSGAAEKAWTSGLKGAATAPLISVQGESVAAARQRIARD